MGNGYSIVCKHCQYQTSVITGIGMGFPTEYKSILRRIQHGYYGAEWKTFMESTPGAAVHIGMEVYQCPYCKTIANEPNLSLYKTNHIIAKGKPFVYWTDSAQTYQFIKSFPHKCPKCSHLLEKISLDKHETINCPICGEKANYECDVLWD